MSNGAAGSEATWIRAAVPGLAALVERLHDAGASTDGVYVVGGAIRDAMLDDDRGNPPGALPFDLDLAVEGDAGAFADLLAAVLGGDVVARHDAFGTATVAVPSLSSSGSGGAADRIDVAACRTESYAEPGALPTVELGATLAADLARRDLTVNAVAIRLAAPEAGAGDDVVIDPFGGVADLRRGIVRVLHDRSFVDDPTRIWRAARYAGRLGFDLDDATLGLARSALAGGAFKTISADRARAELELVLRERAAPTLAVLDRIGVLHELDERIAAAWREPPLVEIVDAGCGTDPVRNAAAAELRLAALASPLGADAPRWLTWLGYGGDVIGRVEDHLRMLDAVLEAPELVRGAPNSEVYRRLGELSDETAALGMLVASVEGDDDLAQRIEAYRSALRTVRVTTRGGDVIALGVPNGPLVGQILGDLFTLRLDGEVETDDDERRALERLANAARGGGAHE